MSGAMPAESGSRPRVAIALAGLHRVNRGAEVALENIARGLARLGFAVTLFGSGPERAGEPYAFVRTPCRPRERFERWPTFPPMRSDLVWEELSYVRSLRRVLDPRAFDVTITCAYPFTTWLLRRAARGGGPRTVFVTQNGDYAPRALNREYRYFSCDGLVCTNPEYFERHRERYASALIPNGVDADRFTPGAAAREALGLPVRVPLVLMSSALIASKRVIEGVRAVGRVPGAHMVVAGDGPLRAEVESAARESLGDRFRRVTLRHEQMPDLYRSADALLHMSRDEPFGNVYLEAMSCGLPIVAHDNPASRWIMEDAATLVDTGSDAAVAGALEAVLRRGVREIRGREIVLRRFDWPVVSQQYAAFIERIAGGGR